MMEGSEWNDIYYRKNEKGGQGQRCQFHLFSSFEPID